MARRRGKTPIRSFQPEGLYELIEASPLVGVIADGPARISRRSDDLVALTENHV
ncbi:MAG: hypothetical protein WA625_00875 [Pseudolabrys sp.]